MLFLKGVSWGKDASPEHSFRVYLAGPLVFHPQALEIAKRMKALCVEYGFVGVFPSDADAKVSTEHKTKGETGAAISERNENLMRGCDFTIANLTPFRGPSCDVGTAFEVGFFTALGKPVFGYSNSQDNFFTRTAEYCSNAVGGGQVSLDEHGHSRDADKMGLEDFDSFDNLMLPGAISRNGGEMVITEAAMARDELYVDLTGFEECLRRASEKVSEIGKVSLVSRMVDEFVD